MSLAWMVALAALGAVALGAAQWALQGALHRRALEALHGRHLQQQQNGQRKLDQARRQITQLQQELAAARLELKERRERIAPPPVLTREALLRELEEAEWAYAAPDGFADTLPSAQYAHAEELLAR